MVQQNYHCSIVASTTVEEAYRNISHVAHWWGADVEGATQQQGDIFTIYFGETSVTFKITRAILGKEVIWDVVDCWLPWLADKTEWTGTKLVWEVSAESGGAKIEMTHVGLTPEIECYDNCKKGWDFFVGQSLYKLITENKGLPNVPKTARKQAAAQA